MYFYFYIGFILFLDWLQYYLTLKSQQNENSLAKVATRFIHYHIVQFIIHHHHNVERSTNPSSWHQSPAAR